MTGERDFGDAWFDGLLLRSRTARLARYEAFWLVMKRVPFPMEGLATLRILHLGHIYRLDVDAIDEEAIYFDTADLRAVEERLLDEKYPETASLA